MRQTLTPYILTGLLIFIAFGVLYPNSFGNNPDLIQDESYFLTSSLSSIEKLTLPGWEFSSSGSYYGGVQTYVDTVVMLPVLGFLYVSNHFSLFQAKIQLAQHTGDLLHILRLVNGATVVLTIGFFFYYFYRKKIPFKLSLQLFLVLFLLLSNSFFIGFVHTAKVWVFYAVIDVSLGVLFLVNEFYAAENGKLFINKKRYTAFLVWGVLLAFFQTFVGAFSASLWVLYALLLGHIHLRDIWDCIVKYWYFMALACATQISFLYRALFLRTHFSLLEFGDYTNKTETGIDWFHRLYDPIVNAFASQPLIIFYFATALVTIFILVRNRSLGAHRRIYLMIALAHPILVYLFFYGLVGFSLFPRYALILAIACSFSAVMLISQYKRVLIVCAALAAGLCMVTTAQAIYLYWQPSSAVELRNIIQKQYNSSNMAFIIEPDASRLSLPLNQISLQKLTQKKVSMSRFQFLTQHLDNAGENNFKPLVLLPDSLQEAADFAHDLTTTTTWTITQDCNRICTASEIDTKSCFAVHSSACNILSSDDEKEYPVLSLKTFLLQKELGLPYIVRMVP